MSRVTDTASFIEKCTSLHGGKYDYSEVVYKDSKTKVKIICPDHGRFEMIAGKHTQGRKCPECAKEASYEALRSNNPKPPKDTEWFVEASRGVHGRKYDYSMVEYKSMHSKVKIVCPEHGSFLQEPNSHLRGRAGCPECAGMRSLSLTPTEWFIEKSKSVHGNKYGYEKVDYINSDTSVTLVCPIHGDFLQRPVVHLRGNNCPKCVGRNRTKEDWIALFRERHGDRYSYDNFKYVSCNDPVTITCKEHGDFIQLVGNHLKYDSGCPECISETKSVKWNPVSAYGRLGHYGTNIPSNFYILSLDDTTIKIGLSLDVDSRIAQIRRETGYDPELIFLKSGPANLLFTLEQHILYKTDLSPKKVDIRFSGRTECFDEKHLDKIISIVENWDYTNEEEHSNEISQTNDG